MYPTMRVVLMQGRHEDEATQSSVIPLLQENGWGAAIRVLDESDPAVAQLTKLILPMLGNSPSSAGRVSLLFTVGPPTLPARGGLAPWRKRRATEILTRNLEGNVRLSEVARECELSVSQFGRAFKETFGVSTHQWLIQHRLERARQLLAETNTPLTSVALEAGYADQASFTRSFTQALGVSPGRWRRHNTLKATD